MVTSDEIPQVYVPSEIWSQVRSWNARHSERFDIQLASGRRLQRIYINEAGLLQGALESEGLVVDVELFEALASGVERIVAIRKRTGSILEEAGLSRWKRRLH